MHKFREINWYGLIAERKALSLGRVSYWITFGITIHFWLAGIAVPTSLMTVFLSLLSYNLGKKVQEVVEGWVAKNGQSVEG